MQKIVKNFKNSETKSISLNEIKDHKLFKEPEFTVNQIIDMCYENKSLDELHELQMYSLTNEQDVAKFRFENM